jgi:hypothetical protein
LGGIHLFCTRHGIVLDADGMVFDETVIFHYFSPDTKHSITCLGSIEYVTENEIMPGVTELLYRA